MNILSSKILKTLLLAIISFLFIGPCLAEIYKWTDNNGVVHFGEQPPNKGKSEIIDIDVVQSSSANPHRGNAITQQKKVVMYETEWCQYCKKAKAYFKKNEIKYIAYDVEKYPSRKRDFKRLGGTGYPLILIGKDERMQGFNVSRFERYYNSSSKPAYPPIKQN
jgi:glutaredoxin